MTSKSADPFLVIKDEVKSTLEKVKGMHEEWSTLLKNENTARSERFQKLHEDIAGDLLDTHYNLQDIQKLAIDEVEANRSRFATIDDAELASRKSFVEASQATVKQLKDALSNKTATEKIDKDRREEESRRQSAEDKTKWADKANNDFLVDQRVQQKELLKSQDDELEKMMKSTQQMNQNAQAIAQELNVQQKLLDELDEDIDKETEKLNTVMKGVGKLLKTSNSSQISAICCLIILFFLLLTLVLNT